MRYQKVVEHSPSVVSSEHVDPVVPHHDGVLTAARANKLFTTGHLLPEMERLGRREVESEVRFSGHSDASHVRGQVR